MKKDGVVRLVITKISQWNMSVRIYIFLSESVKNLVFNDEIRSVEKEVQKLTSAGINKVCSTTIIIWPLNKLVFSIEFRTKGFEFLVCIVVSLN